MEVNLQITVNGLPEEAANKLKKAIGLVIETISNINSSLDLLRMHQVILTMDFANEMAELSKKTVSGNSIKFTNEEYATAIAKVLIFPRDKVYENIKALRNMRELYPNQWKTITIYNELANVIESYYSEMGFILTTTSDGNAYINVLFGQEQHPRLISLYVYWKLEASLQFMKTADTRNMQYLACKFKF